MRDNKCVCDIEVCIKGLQQKETRMARAYFATTRPLLGRRFLNMPTGLDIGALPYSYYARL